jgi:hypothetical protein
LHTATSVDNIRDVNRRERRWRSQHDSDAIENMYDAAEGSSWTQHLRRLSRGELPYGKFRLNWPFRRDEQWVAPVATLGLIGVVVLVGVALLLAWVVH